MMGHAPKRELENLALRAKTSMRAVNCSSAVRSKFLNSCCPVASPTAPVFKEYGFF